MEEQDTTEAEFIFPPDVRYECVECGFCCRQNWVVEVDEECFEAHPEEIGEYASEVPGKNGEAAGRIIRPEKPGGGCPLLGEDNLCDIHKRMGYDAKPFVCREFPFRFITTPRGVLVDVSFVCGEVLNQRGKELEHHEEELKRLYAKTRRKLRIDDKVLLKTKTSITYEAYLLIEETLQEILSQTEYSIEDRLVAGNVFLFTLCKNIFDDDRIVLDEDNIEKRLRRFRPKHFAKLFMIARKSKKMASRHKQQVFVVTFITFASSAFEKRGKMGVLLRTWVNNVKQTLNVGGIKVPLLTQRVPLRRLTDVEFDPENEKIIDLSARYLRHCVFRKVFVQSYGVFRGYNILLLLYGVLKWYSRVFALQAGRKHVEPEDFAKAIQLVEREYVRHNEHFAMLKVDSRAMRFVDRLFGDLGFAPIIVKS